MIVSIGSRAEHAATKSTSPAPTRSSTIADGVAVDLLLDLPDVSRRERRADQPPVDGVLRRIHAQEERREPLDLGGHRTQRHTLGGGEQLGVLADVGDVGAARQRPEPRLLHGEQRRERPVPGEPVTGAQLGEHLVALGERLTPEVVGRDVEPDCTHAPAPVALSQIQRDTSTKICKAMAMEEPLVEADNSTRQRILAATAEVLGRNGMTKLSLSEVALQAGRVAAHAVSVVRLQERPARCVRGVGATVLRTRRRTRRPPIFQMSEKLDAALQVIVDYQQSYPGLRMIDIEPEHVIRRLSRVIPLMRERLERLAQGPDASLAVATAVRVAISHYLVRSDDDDDFLAQFARHATRTRGRAQ